MSTIEVGQIFKKIKEHTGGVDISHQYYNAGEKEIKYITFSYLAYNRVNDIVVCTVNKVAEVCGKVTGPIKAKTQNSVGFGNMWYNTTVHEVVISKIHIQFMDNTEEVIDGKDIVSMQDKESSYYNEITLPAKERKAEKQKEYEERTKISDAAHKIFGHIYEMPKKNALEEACASVFLEFKDDEAALLKILDIITEKVEKGTIDYEKSGKKVKIIGDYIEKVYFTNEGFMKKAVSLWKASISAYQYPILPAIESIVRFITVRKLAQKIRQYEPAYVKPGVDEGIGKLLEKIESIISKK